MMLLCRLNPPGDNIDACATSESALPGVDDVKDAVHRQAGLRDVGGHDALAHALLGLVEDLGLWGGAHMQKGSAILHVFSA